MPFFAGGGEMGDRIRAFDWSATPIGPAAHWPQSLKTACRIMLASRQPIWIGWGAELTYLYNDAYKSIIGGKHPHMLGQPISVVWRELWDQIGPVLARTLNGEGVYVESQLLIMERHGFREETYYTYSFSPIPDDTGRTAGVFCANTEDTGRVIGERQLGLLRELSARTVDSRSWQQAAQRSAEAMGTNRRDLPFALIYLKDPDTDAFDLTSASGIEPGHPAAPQRTPARSETPWPLESVLESREMQIVENLESRGLHDLPSGDWNESPHRVALVPMTSMGESGRGGVLVVGLNPFRSVDESYSNFLNLVAGQISASIASSQAYEDERMRAEALAEIDRTKTRFFSNVSHEFRTPLTLMLGPVEELLHARIEDVETDVHARLEVVHRNGLRMLKLVNTLLDFARLEAGRANASYAETDLTRFTAELASGFESTATRAGLYLDIDCEARPDLLPAVWVDRDMWEKIVLNLVSNALKYTPAGGITVTLRYQAPDSRGDAETGDRGRVVLTVTDTGIGIPDDELPRIFDRFHRVEDAKGLSRTFEGTGIGLALVHELVRLHGGTVSVESTVDEGSRFVVVLPLGAEHLDPKRIDQGPGHGSGGLDRSYFEEASAWVGDDAPPPLSAASASRPEDVERSMADAGPDAEDAADRPRVLLADDNSDMRHYVSRLLSHRFDVEAVADGQAALDTLRNSQRPFDLVLSDVMMPRLDGFQLIREIRADPVIGPVPIILLSARAGENEEVVGIEAGADDYLIKPFSARELITRVDSHIRMARLRREAEIRLRGSEERYRSLVSVITDVPWIADPRGAFTEPQPYWQAYTGQTWNEHCEFGWVNALHPDDREPLLRDWERSRDTGKQYERHGRLWHAASGEYRHFTVKATPFFDASGAISGWIGACTDVHESVTSAEALRDADRRKDEFLATLAHELRNPLAPIRNNLHVLRLAGHQPETARRVHEMMDRQVNHMVRLVDDLMEVSRITRGKIELRRERVDLASVVRSSVETSRPLIDGGKHSLTVEVPNEPMDLHADPVRIAQVLANLLNNAAKYTPPGGRIELQARRDGSVVHVAVRDNGIGIPPELLPTIFELFTQVDRTSGYSKGGLGIGLTLARSLVELHGGTIVAKSGGPGQGSEFVVTLPVMDPAAASHLETQTTDRDVELRHRILVVDDNRDAAESLAMLLEQLAAEVEVANDGPAALDAIRSFRPSVVLLDIDMPGMNGYEVARRARSELDGRPAIIVALTGWGQAEDRRRSADAGIDHHLVKPVDLDVLRQLLDVAFSQD